VRDPSLVARLRDEIIGTYLRDNVKTRRMLPDGTYERVTVADGEAPLIAQEHLLTVRESVKPKRKRKGTPQKRKSGRGKG